MSFVELEGVMATSTAATSRVTSSSDSHIETHRRGAIVIVCFVPFVPGLITIKVTTRQPDPDLQKSLVLLVRAQ